MKDCEKWIPVDSNNVANVMPEKDCEVWIARGGLGKGWIQKINYYSEHGYFDWDGIYAYQQVRGESIPEPYIMEFAGGKTIACEEFV